MDLAEVNLNKLVIQVVILFILFNLLQTKHTRGLYRRIQWIDCPCHQWVRW